MARRPHLVQGQAVLFMPINRKRTVGVRLTDTEYRKLSAEAKRERVPLSTWLRARILKLVETKGNEK